MRSATYILAIGALAVAIAGCKPQSPAPTTGSPAASPGGDTIMKKEGADEKMEKKQTVTVQLAAQNNSGQPGTATLTATADGKTMVSLNLTAGSAGVPQPVHIHVGKCPTPGAVKYPLTNLTAGKSETTLNVSLDNLLKELPLAINAHKSAAAVSVYVACGDIFAEGTMMKKEGAGAVEKKEEGAMLQDKPGTAENAAIDAELNTLGASESDAEIGEMEKEINAE